MLANDLTLADRVPANHVFSLQPQTVFGRALRRDTTITSTDKPGFLTTGVRRSGKGNLLYEDILVRFDRVVEQATTQEQGTCFAQLTLRQFPKLTGTTTDILDQIAFMQNFLTAYKTDLLNGQM